MIQYTIIQLSINKKISVNTIIKCPNALKFIVSQHYFLYRFLHSGTLDMSLLGDVIDYVEFVKASDYSGVAPLLQLSLRLLQPKIEASNVWQVLLRLIYNRQLAAVCDQAIITQCTCN